MNIVTYDCEVFAHDWLVVFKDRETGIVTRVWNDNEQLRECLNSDTIYVGFNSKHYDQFIIQAIVHDFTPEEIKQLNDYIIGGGQGWEYPPLKNCYRYFQNVDIRDDMQAGLSLKAIEGHLGLSIQESTVPFDIDRPLTENERAETEFYCEHDVNTTETLLNLRKDYLRNKVNIGKMAGVPEPKAMAMTNAKLTAYMLSASPMKHDDERDYVYPDNLRREYIPQDVFDFFDRMKDKSLSDKEVFSGKLEITIGECPVTIGFGGIHGAIPNFFWDESENPDYRIRNKDVGSYYPHLCTVNGYTSRNIPSPKVYEDVLERRMNAKKSGDKATANALKLVCNTTYGAMLNPYNTLYDPLMARSVCVSGQLYLLELAQNCHQNIPDLKIVQLNTDGIMVLCRKDYISQLDAICDEWMERTRFDLETDEVVKIAQKDVNNYVEMQTGGQVKCKGGYLVRGIAPAGAFNINNNAVIVATAVKECLTNDVPVEDTINGCGDILKFQLIAKAGSKYSEAFQLVNDERVTVQKVNRVYATADKTLGTLYKVKKENGSIAKIASLPAHCVIDNDNKLSIDDIDKQYYIDLAKKQVNDFKNNRRSDRKMAASKKTPVNVYGKLIEARKKFIDSGTTKSGKNIHYEFKYFELSDIVPKITDIFKEVGLLAITRFVKGQAIMVVINTDNPDEKINFIAPFKPIKPIVSKTGKQAMNDMQAMGASITYMRRYLYMMALDIVESDSIDSGVYETQTPAKKAPANSTEKRAEVKKEMTAPEANASVLQIKQLKKCLKKLKETDPSKEEMITQIAIETQGFTVISKAECEALIEKITEVLKNAKN